MINGKSLVWRTAITAATIVVATGYCVTPGQAAKTTASKPAAKQELPKMLTGFPTNISVQVLRCIRANVPEFGRNNVVVLQFRLRKEGPDTGPVKYFGDDRFEPTEIKCRDPILSSSFEPIGGAGHEESTYSNTAVTSGWKVGQTGDGYAWFKIPERITILDVYFPKTRPMRIPIEIPGKG
jgi:hypothetical protein